MPALLANGDQRFGVARRRRCCRKRNFDEAKAALAPVIATAPIEITIVGDVDENAAIAAVAATFGALPDAQASIPSHPTPERPASAPTAARSSSRTSGPQDKALVESVWPTTDDSELREVIGVELLKDVST